MSSVPSPLMSKMPTSAMWSATPSATRSCRGGRRARPSRIVSTSFGDPGTGEVRPEHLDYLDRRLLDELRDTLVLPRSFGTRITCIRDCLPSRGNRWAGP